MLNYDYIQLVKYFDYNCIKGFYYENRFTAFTKNNKKTQKKKPKNSQKMAKNAEKNHLKNSKKQ